MIEKVNMMHPDKVADRVAGAIVDWTAKGAGLIEQVLEKKFEVAVYGAYDKEPTIVHTDGRKKGAK